MTEPRSSITFIVQEEDIPQRLDIFIQKKLPNYSRSYLQKLIDEQQVKINNTVISKASIPIKQGDIIEINFPPVRLPVGIPIDENVRLDVQILYEHPEFLIIYKPPNLIVHPVNQYSTEITLVDWLIHQFKELKNIGPADRPGIVHRLDKETSGLLIIARTGQAHQVLSDMFKHRKIEKKYLAVTQGKPAQSGMINFNITRDLQHKHKMAHQIISGREALTFYSVREYFKNSALVEVKPVTGRTHQIRVHFSAIGHPLIGDKIYGSASDLINRQALHAYQLSFWFNNIYYSFWQDMPQDMKQLVKNLREEI